MKKLVFIVALAMIAWLQVSAQDNNKLKDKDVPQTVRTAFEKEFDNAMLVDWKMKDGNYKASFTKNMKKHMAEFSSSGELISKGVKIEKDELPSAVSDAVNTSYANSKIDDAYRVEKGGQTLYIVKLDGDTKKKVVFDAQGKVVKEKAKE